MKQTHSHRILENQSSFLFRHSNKTEAFEKSEEHVAHRRLENIYFLKL